MSNSSNEEARKFEEERAREAQAQNLPEGAVPEQRPIASQQGVTHSGIYEKLKAAGDDRAGAPAMPKEAFDKAASDAQAKKADKESRHPSRLYAGARAWINNPGSPDHGRAVAVNGVSEFSSVEDERTAAAGTPESRFANVASYECMSRDGRAEHLIVSAQHLRVDTSGGVDWGKTSLSPS